MPQIPSINHQPTYTLGFDIGGTKTALVLGTLEGDPKQRIEFLTPVNEPFEVAIKTIENIASNFIRDCNKAGLPSPEAISVAVGGPLDIDRGILFAPPHLKNWGEAPLKPHLQAYFQLPVFVEHDGNAGRRWQNFISALAEEPETWSF